MRSCPTIHSSFDYDQFSLSPVNRPIRPAKVASLKDAIRTKDFTSEMPVKINDMYEIMEGQHTFLACVELGYPIYYIRSTITEDDIAAINAEQDKWTMDDYLHHFTTIGLHNYKVFKGFKERHGLTFTVAITMLTKDYTSKPNAALSNRFKEGRFQATRSIAEAEEMASMLNDFAVGGFKGWKSQSFGLAFIKVWQYPEYDHKRMLAKLEYLSTQLVRCPNVDTYLELLERIYNFKASDKVRFF